MARIPPPDALGRANLRGLATPAPLLNVAAAGATGDALADLGAATASVGADLAEERQASDAASALNEVLTTLPGRLNSTLDDEQLASDPGAAGFFDRTSERIKAERESFLSELRQRFPLDDQTFGDISNRAALLSSAPLEKARKFEASERKRFFLEGFDRSAEALRIAVLQGEIPLNVANAQFETGLDAATPILTPAELAARRKSGSAALALARIDRLIRDDPGAAIRAITETPAEDFAAVGLNAKDIDLRLRRAEREQDRRGRNALAQLRQDSETALKFARSTGQDAGEVEQRLVDAGEVKAAAAFAEQRDANIEIHDTVKDLELAGPSEIQARFKELGIGTDIVGDPLDIGDPGPTTDQARATLLKRFVRTETAKGVAANRKALAADPAGYALRDPDVRAAFEAFEADPGDPELAQRAASISLAVQEKMGLAESDRRMLTVSQARAAVARIEDPETGAREQAAVINGLAETYGPRFRAAYRDLVREGLSEGRQVLALLGDDPLAARMARALDTGLPELRKAVGNDDAKIVESGVRQGLEPYAQSIRAADASGLGGSVKFINGVEAGITALALGLVADGTDPDEGAARATAALTDRYSFVDSYRVPRPFDADRVAAAAADTLLRLGDLNVAPAISVSDSDLSLGDRRAATIRAALSFGRWVTNEDETGLVLLIDTGSGFEVLRDVAGNRIEVKFDATGDVEVTPQPLREPAMNPIPVPRLQLPVGSRRRGETGPPQ